MDALNNLWTGVLQLLTPIVTPDWGQLVGLLPILLLLPVLAYLYLVTRAWMRLRRQLPASYRRSPNRLVLLVAHAGGVLLGIVTCALAFLAAGSAADGTMGLVVSVPLLVVGLVIVVATVGSGIVTWEGGTVDEDTGEEDPSAVWIGRYRHPIALVLQFAVGVAIAALGLLLPPPADATGVQPVASVPLLVLGLLVAIIAAGRAVSGFRHDDDATDLVPVDSAAGASHAG